jgi:hypothetical protein
LLAEFGEVVEAKGCQGNTPFLSGIWNFTVVKRRFYMIPAVKPE